MTIPRLDDGTDGTLPSPAAEPRQAWHAPRLSTIALAETEGSGEINSDSISGS